MIDRWKIAFIKLWLKKKKKKWNIYTRRVVNDRYDINRNRITRRSLASFAPSIEMFFPQIWFQQDLAANRSPTLFASVMKYSLLFSTWFYINIYVCIRTFRNLLASFHKLNTREFSGSFDLGERKDRGKRISEGVFQREPLFVREFQIIFYCLGKRYQG